jgi:hypothetical protein
MLSASAQRPLAEPAEVLKREFRMPEVPQRNVMKKISKIDIVYKQNIENTGEEIL